MKILSREFTLIMEMDIGIYYFKSYATNSPTQNKIVCWKSGMEFING